jgi:hypothetical protein
MTSTPNKGYTLQQTGTNSGTWGVVLNSILSAIDSNLGGTLSLSVAGSSNVTLTTSQAQNLIYNFTGALTGNINVIFPAQGGFYFINNQTTGSYTITIQAGNSTAGLVVPQGTQSPVYVDNSSGPPTVGGLTGTQYVYSLGTIAGTANALACSVTYPSNFQLNPGTLITFTPTADNTGSATLAINGGTAYPLQTLGAVGLVNLVANQIFAGTPNLAYWNGSVWVLLNVIFYGTPTQTSANVSLSFANLFEPIIATSAINITLPQVSINLAYYFSCSVTAGGGPVTWIPYSTDVIWINGFALPAGGSYVQPKGSVSYFVTDANGNIYLSVINNNLSSLSTSSMYGLTAPAGTSTNLLATTAFVNSTALTLASGSTAVTQTAADSSTKVATTAFVSPKAWGYFTWNGSSLSVIKSLNITSIIRSGPGIYVVTMTNPLSDSNYAVLVSPDAGATAAIVSYATSRSSSSQFTITTVIVTNSAGTDPAGVNFAVFD